MTLRRTTCGGRDEAGDMRHCIGRAPARSKDSGAARPPVTLAATNETARPCLLDVY